MTENKKSNAEFLKWFKPVIEALKELGGSAEPEEVRKQISKDLSLSDEIVNETYGKSNTNKFANQVAFARNYLVYGGYVDKSKPGIWSLTEKGKNIDMTDKLASDIFIENAPKHVSKQNTHLSWIPFYEELADKLLEYKTSRNDLLEKLNLVFTASNISFPKLEEDGSRIDIDPFTVFGFFNKHITSENRVKITMALKDVFQIEAEIPTDFDAIPVLNNLKSVFFAWKTNRNDSDIDNLWAIFEEAIKSSEDKERIIELYSKCITQKCIRWNLSMGLFWIRPNKYIPLDTNTRNYLKKHYEIEIKNPISGNEYFDLLNRLKNESFTKISYDAWKKSTYSLEETSSSEVSVHYWIYSPGENAIKWEEFHEKGIMALGWEELGDLKAYDSRDEIKEKLQEQYTDSSCMNSSLATWQFVNEMKVGDIIFVKKGMYKVIGRGVVTGDYEFDASRADYNHIRKVNWTHDGEWKHPGQAVMKTLTDITDYTDYVEKLNALFEIEEEPSEEIRSFEPYDKSNFLSEVFISPEKYETILGLLERKKNIILQGAPGVGKSFAAKRLAYSILEEKNTNQVKVIQFHQSYSYEDFIVGFRPSEDEGKQFEKRYGVFYDFCKKAADDNNNKYFFIIDEINRGNLSKIFGELLLLIENDKRGKEYKIQLLYSKEDFYIPENVYIIGMMNTADRSLAMIDYALRRRFSFVEFEPAFETEGFKQLQEEISNEKYNRLIEGIIELNKEIAEDVSLGKGFRIGHSYFVPKESSDVNDQWLSDVVNYEILPLLEEYWFDETDKIENWKHKLQDAIK